MRNVYHLIEGDSVEVLPTLKDESVDLVLTSPPYNIGKEYEDIHPLDDYVAWSEKWMNEVYRLTKPTGAFLLNVGYLEVPKRGLAVPLAYLLWDKTDFYLMQEIVWNYGAGVACRRRLSPRNEKILWYVKDKSRYTFNLDEIRDENVKYPNQKKKGKLRCNTIGKNPSDVWQIAKVTSGKRRASPERMAHPAQFPEDLIERLILGFSNVGDTVLDPFCGSGTTMKMTQDLQRSCVGIEINSGYCEIIKNRCFTRHFLRREVEYKFEQFG